MLEFDTLCLKKNSDTYKKMTKIEKNHLILTVAVLILRRGRLNQTSVGEP